MVFVELGIDALLFAGEDTRKMAPSRSLTAGTFVRQAICERYSTPRLRDPMQLLRASIILTDLLFDIHEAWGPFLMTQPRAKGQHLASPCEPNHLSTNTRIVPSSSCMERKPAVKPCSYRPSPRYTLSLSPSLDCVRPSLRTRAFLPQTLNSLSYLVCWLPCPLPLHVSHVTPINPLPPGCGLLARILGRQGFCLLVVVSGTCSPPLLPILEYKT